MTPLRFLFLFSDTGGGHRSAAEAVREAVLDVPGIQAEVDLVDILLEYAPPPFNRLPALYPSLVKNPARWELFYRLSDGRRRAGSIQSVAWPYVRSAAQRTLRNHPADLVVSFHMAPIDSTVRTLKRLPPERRRPFVVIVTDLVSTHAFWFHRGADLTIVPTAPALRHALASGLRPERVVELGLPVADRFCRPPEDRSQLREALGWPLDRRMILLIGGGDGMGPVEATARAIDRAGLPAGLAVVAGRNAALRERLERTKWQIPVFPYGFVRNMPEMMGAADILVTKAGPGTISEGLNAGLPILLYSYLPGQETGNVPYLTECGAGIWAPGPVDVVSGLRVWLEDPAAYERARTAARGLARPDAARQIAARLIELAQKA